MEYTEVRFSIECEPALKDIAADLLTDMASDCGFEAFTNESDVLTGYAQTEEFDKFGLDNMIAEFPLENVTITYTIDKAPNENWNTTWEDNGFEPIDINGKCVIYDARHVDNETVANDERMTILIEAKQAFGTGTHETTRMVVSQLMSLDLKEKSVLDCGCGTGILSIAASKLGAANVVGYDIDEWSVDNTRHNAELNGVAENIEVLHGNSTVLNHVSGVFDVVLANINRNILIADMGNFCKVMKHGTTLIISGFYEEDIPLLLEEASKHDLNETRHVVENNWACMVLTYK